MYQQDSDKLNQQLQKLNEHIKAEGECYTSKTTKMSQVDFTSEMFTPMCTCTPIDFMFSFEGGIFPATNYMIIGDAGSGKTTLGLDVISQVQLIEEERKVLFISAEMNKIDMFGYAKRYPKFNDIEILFTGEYTDENIQKIIEDVLEIGYDLVLVDSFIEIQQTIMESSSFKKNQAEKWIIDLMYKHNMANNAANKYTSFLMIQQVTKSGQFAGSNKLKHITTGMCELRASKDYMGERYMSFSKNRRGFKYDRLYYSLEPENDVSFNSDRLEREKEIKKLRKIEEESKSLEEKDFMKLLDSLPTDLPTKTSENTPEIEQTDYIPLNTLLQ